MAKLSSASIRLVQKMNRPMKDGTYPIYIVVCFHGRMEKKTGVSCLSRYWDSKRECIKGGCTNAPLLNKILSDIKNRVVERKNQFEFEKKVYTPQMLLNGCEVNFNGSSNVYKVLMDKLIEDRRLKYSTASTYRYSFSLLCEFMHRDDFIVDELTVGVMKDFGSWLEKKINSNTIKHVISQVAAVWNYAIDRRIVSADGYPFGEWKYSQKYRANNRDYFLEKSHIIRLRDYFLNMCIEWVSEKMWRYREGVEDRLRKRYTTEFSLLWLVMMYRLQGLAPIDFAMLKVSDCRSMMINGERYWAIDTKRRKTDMDVSIRLKRDILTIIGFEHQLGWSKEFVYPIIHWKEGMSEKQMEDQCHSSAQCCLKKLRKVFEVINREIARDNALNGCNEPLIESERVVLYTVRHSFASHYISSPNASVNGLATLLGRSSDCISTYIHRITKDEDLAEMLDVLPI